MIPAPGLWSAVSPCAAKVGWTLSRRNVAAERSALRRNMSCGWHLGVCTKYGIFSFYQRARYTTALDERCIFCMIFPGEAPGLWSPLSPCAAKQWLEVRAATTGIPALARKGSHRWYTRECTKNVFLVCTGAAAGADGCFRASRAGHWLGRPGGPFFALFGAFWDSNPARSGLKHAPQRRVYPRSLAKGPIDGTHRPALATIWCQFRTFPVSVFGCPDPCNWTTWEPFGVNSASFLLAFLDAQTPELDTIYGRTKKRIAWKEHHGWYTEVPTNEHIFNSSGVCISLPGWQTPGCQIYLIPRIGPGVGGPLSLLWGISIWPGLEAHFEYLLEHFVVKKAGIDLKHAPQRRVYPRSLPRGPIDSTHGRAHIMLLLFPIVDAVGECVAPEDTLLRPGSHPPPHDRRNDAFLDI
eukprot:gene10229-biopygen3278